MEIKYYTVEDGTTTELKYQVDFSEEIDQGAEWLSGEDPRWFDEVHLDELDLTSAQQCVLGQLAMRTFHAKVSEHLRMEASERPSYASSYSGGYDALLAAIGEDNMWAADHGFYVDHHAAARLLGVDESDFTDTDDPDNRFVWESLTLQWVDRIGKLRSEAGTALNAG